MIEKQELYCHECKKYVQFDLDLEMNGKHILNCPNCGHEHYRYVIDGEISNERWGSNNKSISNSTYTQTIYVPSSTVSYTTMSTWDSCTFSMPDLTTSGTPLISDTDTSIGQKFIYQSWMNRGTFA